MDLVLEVSMLLGLPIKNCLVLDWDGFEVKVTEEELNYLQEQKGKDFATVTGTSQLPPDLMDTSKNKLLRDLFLSLGVLQYEILIRPTDYRFGISNIEIGRDIRGAGQNMETSFLNAIHFYFTNHSEDFTNQQKLTLSNKLNKVSWFD